MAVDYVSNKMLVLSEIVSPPVKTVRYTPIKDAYLSQYFPIESFGSFQNLLLNSGEITENKIIMTFRIPALTKEVLENITTLKLVLWISAGNDRNAKIQLKRHYDNDWVEDGTTYVGQPYEYPEVISEIEIKPKDLKIEFNLMDILYDELLKGEEISLAYTVVENLAEDGTQPEINIYSREFGIANPKYYYKAPAIELSYEYFPENIEIMDLPSQFTIQRVMNGSDPNNPAPDLPGIFEIKSKYIQEDLISMFTVTTYTGEDDLEGKFTIQRYGYTIALEGQFTIRRNIPNATEKAPDLPGQVTIPLYLADDGVNPDPDPTKFYVVHKAAPYLESTFKVKTYVADGEPDDPTKPWEIHEDPLDLEGKFIIRRNVPNKTEPAPDLESEFKVKTYIADGEPDDPKIPWEVHEDPAELEGQFDIKVAIPDSAAPSLDGEFRITLFWADDEPNDPDIPWEKHVDAPYLEGQFTIRRHVPDKYTSAPELEGIFIIPIYLVDDEPYDKDKPWEIHESSPYLEGQFTIRRNVPDQYEPAPDLESEFYVKLFIADGEPDDPEIPWEVHEDPSFLDGEFNIKVAIPDDNSAPSLDGEFRITLFWADDEPDDPDIPWVKHVDALYLEGQFTIRRNVPDKFTSAPDLEGIFIIPIYLVDDEPYNKDKPWELHEPSPYLEGEFTIRRNVPDKYASAPDLESEFYVKLFIADGEPDDPEIPWEVHKDPVDLEGQFDLMYGGTDDLESQYAVKSYIADDGDNPDPDHPWITHVPSYNLACQFICRMNENRDLESQFEVLTFNVPSVSEPAPDLPSVFIIPIYIADSEPNDPDKPWEVHSKAADLKCQFTVGRRDYTDLESKFVVRLNGITADLESTFFITESAYLNGQLVVRRTKVADCEGIFVIVRGVHSPYVYIM